MRKSKTKYVILGLLSESDLTGYEIKKIIDIRFSFFWNESYGQLYPELKRLEKEGSINCLPSETESHRDIIRYSITDQGMTQLKQWLAEPTEQEAVRFEILLKMYFSNITNEDVMIKHIMEFRENHQRQLSILNMFQKELMPIKEMDNHEDVLRVIDFGQKVYSAYISWGEETIHYLEKRMKNETKN